MIFAWPNGKPVSKQDAYRLLDKAALEPDRKKAAAILREALDARRKAFANAATGLDLRGLRAKKDRRLPKRLDKRFKHGVRYVVDRTPGLR
jgi:hypothetical protein